MTKQEILSILKSNDAITVVLEDGGDFILSRNMEGLWRRKVWGACGYLTDEEMAKELEEDYDISFMF